MSQQLAPGLRVEVRDAEWRVKRIDHTTDGGQVLACEGLSELVRGRESLFLTNRGANSVAGTLPPASAARRLSTA